MSDESQSNTANTRRISLKNLHLDPNNYRLIHEADQVAVSEEKIKEKTVAQRTFRLLAGEKNQHIQDLLDSFKANGYLPVDQIQVRELKGGGYVVVEGNRRIAALKLLEREYDQKGIDLGKLDPAIFTRVPVVLYEDANEMHHLTLMALKHISGNRKWGEWNQAKLLEKMHSTYRLGENEICRRVGISKVELKRSLRALALVEQYQKSDYGDQFNESKFPIFREAVRNSSLKNWLYWDDHVFKATNLENREFFFSLLSREPDEEEEDDGYAGYNEKYLEAAITKRDDVVLFSKILKDKQALENLRNTRDLNAAYRVSDLVFKERQQLAIKSLLNDVGTLSQLAIQSEQLPDLEDALGKLQGVVNRTRGSTLSGVEQNSVFHDRLEQHFSSLHVNSYKKLQGLELHKLARVNVIAGLNNRGKTTLLEAIYLLVRQNDFDGILEVIRRRGKIPEDHINPSWLIEQLSGELNVSGTFDHQATTITLKDYADNDPSIDKSRYMRSLEITAQFGQHIQESQTHIFKGRDRQTQADSIKLLSPVVYSSPFFLNEPQRYARFYEKSVQSKSKGKILEFIKKTVSPSIADIDLVDHLQRFLVTDDDYDSAMDLGWYGEGLQRIFFISLLFASAQNGVVLIDELENAIHTELLNKFAPFIHQLAEMFNVQVFLTSHSKECIDAFAKTAPAIEDFTFHTLLADDNDKIIVREFDGKKFSRLLEIGDIDLRRMR